MIPAAISLAQQTWRTEAGAVAPLLLALGGWTLWEAYRRLDIGPIPASPIVIVPIFALISTAFVFAAAIDMVALLALCAWAGGVLTFYAMNGWARTRQCAFPLLFLGMVVPLPYSISLPANTALRDWLAHTASELAQMVGLSTAFDRNYLFVDQYVLEVETACAGLNSTVSLIAIGLLFAYWARAAGKLRFITALLLAAPIAMAANVLRVVALLLAVKLFGARILETAIHPLSGVLSFTFALSLFYTIDRIVMAASHRNNLLRTDPVQM